MPDLELKSPPSPRSHAKAASDANPVLVEVTRGDMVESRHRGAIAVVNADAEVVAAWGDVKRLVYPRSALKPLQALALVETGGVDAFSLDDRHIALACASHESEHQHIDLVAAWLARLGLDNDDLECGPQLPRDRQVMEEVIRDGRGEQRIHNNCSGKHAGFLTVAHQLGAPARGYTRFDHPVQQRLLGLLEQISATELTPAPRGIDGCGIPVYGMPLANCAYAMARFAAPDDLPEPRAAAVRQVQRAMAAYPELVGGRLQFTSIAQRDLGQAIAIKTGAEGVYMAALPEHGLGIALKIDDGASRASAVTIAGVLRRLGVYDPKRHARMTRFLDAPLSNWAGDAVGEVRLAADAPF